MISVEVYDKNNTLDELSKVVGLITSSESKACFLRAQGDSDP